jgi:hypothetical protein
MSASATGELRCDLINQFEGSFLGRKRCDHLAARSKVTLLRFGDNFFNITSRFLGLWQRRLDLAVLDQRGSQAFQESSALVAFATELASVLTVSMHLKAPTPRACPLLRQGL